jgi:hypothetical protein
MIVSMLIVSGGTEVSELGGKKQEEPEIRASSPGFSFIQLSDQGF